MTMSVHPKLRKFQTKDPSRLFESGAFTVREYHRALKDMYKEFMAYGYHDPLAHSMEEGFLYERFHREEESGESWCYYGFAPFEPEEAATMTDMELAEWFDEYVRVRINADYDCTGKPFTVGITFHRNPNGRVSFVHHMALDI